MKFVLVNGRTPRPQSFCALCCEAIGESYLRELSTRLFYCDHKCYAGHCKIDCSCAMAGDSAVITSEAVTPNTCLREEGRMELSLVGG